ncbi:ribonuclease H-like domain-containing protein [Tanacetum coccineum]
MHSLTPPSAHPDTPPHHNTSQSTTQSTTQPIFAYTTPTSATKHTIPDPPTQTHLMVTRAQVGTVKTNPLFHSHTSHISPISLIPKSPSIVLSYPNCRDAMHDEYNALIKNSTWPIHQLDVKNAFLNGCLSETMIGFSSSRCDSSLFIYQHGSEVAYILIYVDDIILMASSTNLVQRITSSLHKEFDMTDLGALNYFLGISVTRDSRGMFLSQKKYALELLDRAHMANCNPTRTPVDMEFKLGSDRDPVSDPTLYRSLAGLPLYDPREPHLAALKRVLLYGTLDLGLQLYASITGSLVAYIDADWPGCPTNRRSTSGYCVFLGDNLLSWSAKRQHTLSRSSDEAEELHTPLLSATLVNCDNVSAIYMIANLVQHQQTKHIEIDIHFVHDMVARGQVRVLHVPSRYQYADIFTKGLSSALFEEFRTSLSVRPSPAQTARAY